MAQERDRAGRHIIQGLIAPIGHSEGEFDAVEWKSFVEWSALDDSRLKLRALEAALAEPETALRVARRAEFVIQACVGLSPIRHAQALELVSAKQRDQNADPRSRIAACWLALALGSTDLPALEESVLWLGVYDNDHDKQFPEFLDSVVRCNDPEQQAAIASSLPHALISHMQRGYQHDYEFPAETFTWLRECLTDSQIAEARTALTPLMDSDLFGVQEEGIEGLELLAPRFSPQQASETITQLIHCIEIETARDSSVAWRAADALGPMAARADATAFEQVWQTLNRLLRDPAWTEDGRGLAPCARSMQQMLPRLSGSQIVEGWSALVTCIAAPPSGEISEIDDFCDALHALGMRLQDSDVAPLADAVVAHTQRATTLRGKIAALSAIETLAARFDSDRAAVCWDVAFALLDWDKVKNQPQTCLEALAPRMDEAACGARWRLLVDDVTTARATESISATVTGLRILAPRLSEADKSASAGTMLQHLEQPQEPLVRALLLEGLVPLSASLSDADVIRCGDLLKPEFAGSFDSRTFPAVIRVFSALVSRWSDAQIETVLQTVFEVLSEGDARGGLNAGFDAIVALAPRLDEQAAEELWRQWIAHRETNDKTHWGERFLRAEDELSRRLADFGGTTAMAHFQTLLESSSGEGVRHTAARRLVDIAPQLSELELAQVCQSLLDALARAEDPTIATMLIELFPLVSPSEATRMTNAAATIALDRNAAGAGDPFFAVWRFDRNVGFVVTLCDVTVFDSPESKWLDPRRRAQLLSHPGCTGKARQRLLQRFEEIVLHDGQQVFLRPEPEADVPGDAVAPVPVPPRRLHDLHDVALWIQANWPDFDLETNCPAAWRP